MPPRAAPPVTPLLAITTRSAVLGLAPVCVLLALGALANHPVLGLGVGLAVGLVMGCAGGVCTAVERLWPGQGRTAADLTAALACVPTSALTTLAVAAQIVHVTAARAGPFDFSAVEALAPGPFLLAGAAIGAPLGVVAFCWRRGHDLWAGSGWAMALILLIGLPAFVVGVAIPGTFVRGFSIRVAGFLLCACLFIALSAIADHVARDVVVARARRAARRT